jgi:hypothetical protein
VRPGLAVATLAASIIISSGAGCSSRGPKPQIHRYILGPASTATLTTDRPPIESGVVSGLTPFRDTEIAYESTPYRLDTYTFSRWSAPPIEIVSERIGAILQQPPNGPKSSLPTMLLDTHIMAFQEVDDGEHVSGLVTISFCLRPKHPPSKMLWCQTLSHQTAASANSREAAVAAITGSVNSVFDDLIAELDLQFGAMPVAEPSDEESEPAHKKSFKTPKLQ